MAAKEAQAVQFARKLSTQDLWFSQPAEIVGKTQSRNGHLTYEIANQHGEPLRLNVPDWFRDQYDENVDVGDHISGGWQSGAFTAEVWCVV